MNRLTIALLIALVVSSCTSAFAGLIEYDADRTQTGELPVEVEITENPLSLLKDNWKITIKDNDADDPNAADITSLDTTGVSMVSMGTEVKTLGKVYLKIEPWNLYQVVVYTNNMGVDPANPDDNLPWNWTSKGENQKQDFIDKHAGLQVQTAAYLDNEGFNSNLYGASLKVRSEGIHGTSAKDNLSDLQNDGSWGSYSATTGESVPNLIWNSDNNEVEFTPVPERASELKSADLPADPDTGLKPTPVEIAGSMRNSPLKNSDGSDNWLEVILAASEKNTVSGDYSTTVYFELRWN